MFSKAERDYMNELKDNFGISQLTYEYQRVLKSRIKKKVEIIQKDMALYQSIKQALKQIK